MKRLNLVPKTGTLSKKPGSQDCQCQSRFSDRKKKLACPVSFTSFSGGRVYCELCRWVNIWFDGKGDHHCNFSSYLQPAIIYGISGRRRRVSAQNGIRAVLNRNGGMGLGDSVEPVRPADLPVVERARGGVKDELKDSNLRTWIYCFFANSSPLFTNLLLFLDPFIPEKVAIHLICHWILKKLDDILASFLFPFFFFLNFFFFIFF